MSIEQRLDLERDDRRHEGTLACLGGRLKFQFCRRCGTNFGMQHVHRETLAEMTDTEIEALEPWYRCRESLTDEYLYYPCPRCNDLRFISDNFALVSTGEVLEKWRADCGLPNWGWDWDCEMSPDYAALAEPEPVLASQDSRDSAGI